MIQKIQQEDRYLAEHGWLTSFHLFSFADYYDPHNMNWGVLRVFNDDSIDGESGFGAHSHRDMEIVTIMLEGELTHEDTMGNRKTMKAGEVQYMSAGSGVTHREINSGKERTHLYQIWIMPKVKGLKPSYDQKDFRETMKSNTLVPVASDRTVGGALLIQADATIYMAELKAGTKSTYAIEGRRGVFIYITRGSMTIQGIVYSLGDQARIKNENRLTLSAVDTTVFVMIDVLL